MFFINDQSLFQGQDLGPGASRWQQRGGCNEDQDDDDEDELHMTRPVLIVVLVLILGTSSLRMQDSQSPLLLQ